MGLNIVFWFDNKVIDIIVNKGSRDISRYDMGNNNKFDLKETDRS